MGTRLQRAGAGRLHERQGTDHQPVALRLSDGQRGQPVGACAPDCQQVHIMLRIRGSIGQWPVDLTLELDEGDWARLGAQLKAVAPEVSAAVVESKPVNPDDRLWQVAQELLHKAGHMSGPDLLAQLEGLTGSTAAGKHLLVRLRHSANVKVESGGDAPLYSWIETV
ncbi:hypothetical protein ALO83_100759 [Pseudomonas cannabina pv. alisalensis]|uniref:Uncharacterized protein n=4 Tax=Pseudomonas syringae group TaxID=136849 RepID=A0A3M3S1N7_PSECA|nr:hypothetical protein ALO83_100759 [Pseudomonas cannabina pv. alisalensis]RMN75161.1 hypothetical protein ALQ52_100922 [Pseudomonas cannabina pv. alisalensis]RMN77292.1 hypothetical protein ALQ53_100718 [Pseudomonas cannabina]RMO02505.1 hypothetical protein ALQ51_100393 [Pseudomonas cannabina]